MANLVTALNTDSVNDGSGPSTTLEPPQVTNALDDAIIIKVIIIIIILEIAIVTIIIAMI